MDDAAGTHDSREGGFDVVAKHAAGIADLQTAAGAWQGGLLLQARGTLHRGIDPDFDNYKGKGKVKRDNSNTEGIYTYWDLDRHAFRTFKAFNLVES